MCGVAIYVMVVGNCAGSAIHGVTVMVEPDGHCDKSTMRGVGGVYSRHS